MSRVTLPRDLDWPDCANTRDLGGLSVADGGVTRFGAVVRSDHPSRLTDAGWDALWDHGIRTVISLETDTTDPRVAARNNVPVDVRERRAGLTHLRLRIEDGDDTEFMSRWAATGLWLTPLYYADALHRWPARYAALVRHVARSRPGGVLIHCGRGCDRTGLASTVLLAVAGASPDDIAADYVHSAERLAAREPEYAGRLQAMLDAAGTSVGEVFAGLLGSFDVESYLRAAGLGGQDLAAARDRLVAHA
jgi:protein-tyrosine phosphatase